MLASESNIFMFGELLNLTSLCSENLWQNFIGAVRFIVAGLDSGVPAPKPSSDLESVSTQHKHPLRGASLLNLNPKLP